METIKNKTLYLQLADFNKNGECIRVEPVRKVNYNTYKLKMNEYGEQTVLLDSMGVKYDVVLGELQETEHFDPAVPSDSKYCALIYSFDSMALKKAARDFLWTKATPILQTKHTYKY